MLVPNVKGVLEFEDFSYVASTVWSAKTGKDALSPQSGYSFAGSSIGKDPSGKRFEDDGDHLSQRYPKLWKRFGETPLGF